MERLTKRLSDDNKNAAFGVKAEIVGLDASITGKDIMPFVTAVNRLADLEDAMERGELVYAGTFDYENGKVVISSVGLRKSEIHRLPNITIDEKGIDD